MELGVGGLCRFHPDISRKSGVQGPVELLGFPSCRKGHSSDLTGGMDPTVRSTCCHNGTSRPRETLQSGLHLALDRTAPGLDLPPEEIGPVVMDRQSESAFGIWVHADKVEGRGDTSRKDWTQTQVYAYR